MHFYLFDSFLADPKYKKILEEIENRILDLDIGGRTLHLTVLRNFEDSLKSGLSNKYSTAVIIGDDSTLHKALPIVAKQKVPLGIIPVGENIEICKTLGIPADVAAVDVVANRLIEKIDLGVINNHYFISKLEGSKHNFVLTCDNNYDIEISKHQHLNICNLSCLKHKISDPRDGLLETIVFNQKKSFFGGIKIQPDSHFQNKTITIKAKGKSAPILADKCQTYKTPVDVSVLENGLNLIVGRNRKF